MQHLTLCNIQAPGDILMITAAVRDLHQQYPGRFVTDAQTGDRDYIWANNPHIKPVDKAVAQVLNMGYTRQIDASFYSKKHFVGAFHETLTSYLKIPLKLSQLRADIHFSEKEKTEPVIKGKYWLILAGGKADFTAKLWDPVKYQAVVDALKDEVAFVQVGGGPHLRRPSHIHYPLNNVINLIGQTNVRHLMQLILHAQGVVCGVTFAMHVAGALNKPCVVIAGGREPPTWEAYTKDNWRFNTGIEAPADFVDHRFLHTIGRLACCSKTACGRKAIGEADIDRRGRDPNCRYLATTPVGVKLPQCLDSIMAEDVIASVRSYGTARSTIKELEVGAFAPTASSTAHVSTASPPIQPGVAMRSVGKPTICVLLYGEFAVLHRRCIMGIVENTPRDRYKLIVGCNQICSATFDWLPKSLEGVDHKLIVEPTNIHKYPMMRKMFAMVDTDWIVWFDDDSHVFSNPRWLDQLAENVNKETNAQCFGKKYYYHLKPGQMDWVKQAAWYKGVPFRQNKGLDTVDFATGGFWAIMMDVVRKLDWPDPRINHNGGDVMLGAALKQAGIEIYQVQIPGVCISDYSRRGYSETHPGIKR